MKGADPKLLHEDATSQTLIFMVKYMFAVWFVRYLIDPLHHLSEIPIHYTSPISFMGWLPENVYLALHSALGLTCLRLMILVSCIAVWIPKYRMPGAAVGCVLISVINAITRGYGHVNHAEIGPLLVTGILTLFMFRLPKGQAIAPDNQENSAASTGLILATFCFALTYSFVGVARFVHGGIDLLAGDTITNAMLRMSHHDWLLEHNLSAMLIASPLMLLTLKLGTAFVTVFEAAAPLCLVSEKFRKCFLLLMPAFHIGTVLVFKINFIENVLTMMLFINLTPLVARLSASQPAGGFLAGLLPSPKRLAG